MDEWAFQQAGVSPRGMLVFFVAPNALRGTAATPCASILVARARVTTASRDPLIVTRLLGFLANFLAMMITAVNRDDLLGGSAI